MAFGPPLAGASLAFAFTVLLALFIYIKHRRRRVKDLFRHYEEFKIDVDMLLNRWEDINNEIRTSATIEPNKEYEIWEINVRGHENRFQEIEQRYKDLETIRSTAGIDNQRSQEDGQITQELSNRPSNIRERKICPRKFFKLAALDKDIVKFFKRAALDKDIVKLLPNVSTATTKLVLGAVTCPKKPKIVEKKKAEELNTVPSHKKHLDDLRQLLKQENCKRIGICGAPEVGKTNIMRNLNNCFDSSPSSNCDFDYVIQVRVGNSEDKIIETVQNEIMERLNLNAEKSRTNSHIISTELSQKKYLLLLDNFSPSVDLEEVGIKKEHQNGKVVLVAKSFNPEIRKQLDLNKIIEVKSLSSQESGELFRKYIDHELTQAQEAMISPILEEVGGLPGPITSVATHLNAHRQEEKYWEGIKQRLQSHVGRADFLGLGGLIGWYRKAFENLEGNDLKKCLLYAAVFPNEYMIPRNTLVECWKAENFLKCDQPTLKAARSEGHVIFEQLEMIHLLKSCCKKHVKMPVFSRKVALVLPFPEEGDGALCVRSGSDRDGHLKEKECNNLRRVSMMGSKLKALPTSPKCSCISTLLLQDNKDLSSIEDAFFTKMHNLRVLDLHDTGIASLPHTISNLKKLRSLYLNRCGSLKQLPTTIAELKDLEVLDIRHTSIPCLPDQISELVSLGCLRISCAAETYNLSGGQPMRWIFPPMIYENLTELEELTIEFSREVSDRFVESIKMEVEAGFAKREDFPKIFKRYSGQAGEENCEHLDGNNTVRKDKGK